MTLSFFIFKEVTMKVLQDVRTGRKIYILDPDMYEIKEVKDAEPVKPELESTNLDLQDSGDEEK